jgi:NitT/TauT family transport system permease protein
MDISGMFAVLMVLALLGIVLYALVRFLHVRVVFWAKPDNLHSGSN